MSQIRAMSAASLQLREALRRIVAEALAAERRCASEVAAVPEAYRPSARNLLHYVTLRDHDLRELQDELSRLGLSSLGRSESCTMASLQAVLSALDQGLGEGEPLEPPPVDMRSGPELLRLHAERLLGPPPKGRETHIMVTLPSEAAFAPELVRALVAAGMDVARINGAHDERESWERMVAHVRRAAQDLGRPCRVYFDLGGPKLRTGELEPGPRVLHWRPQHDARGNVTRKARVLLAPAYDPALATGPLLPLPPELLEAATLGDELCFADCRGRRSVLRIVESAGPGRFWGESARGCYAESGLAVELRRQGEPVARGAIGELPCVEIPIALAPGDLLEITLPELRGRPALFDERGAVLAPARVPCTLPEVFGDIRPGELIWLDDGKIGGRVERAGAQGLLVRVSHTAPGGSKLRGDKGINLPESELSLPALTPKDLADLDFAAAQVDGVLLSFARRPSDLSLLEEELARRDAARLGIVLKVETRAAFESLPRMLLTGLQSPPFGVMVARGDLAVEMGFERLAEVQEEILWLAEAAHVPVVWATQVLENLAKSGQPSRAEVTDAAMSGRAECVMLNKGPHIVEAVRFLDDVLVRMEAHQHKKRARLRRLSVSKMSETRRTKESGERG